MEKEQKKMEVSGSLKKYGTNNRTVFTSFLLHHSSRVLRGKGVLIGDLGQIGMPIRRESIIS